MPDIPARPNERFVPIDGWPGYWISDQGRVWSDKTHRFLRPGTQLNGYQFVVLTKPGQKRNHRIHVLVAQHFLGPRPPGFEVNHKNGIKEDNRVANLAWVSHRENMRHALRTGLNWARGERHPHAKLTEAQVRELRAAYARGGVTQKELAHRVGVSPGYMNLILRGKRWRHLAA